MTVLVPVSVALIVLCILWLPTYSMALLLRGMGVPRPFAGLQIILPAQLLAAVVLAWLADALGLRDLAGCVLAILLAVSVAGVAIVWRGRRRDV